MLAVRPVVNVVETKMEFYTPIKNYCDALLGSIELIDFERKKLLDKLVSYIQPKLEKSDKVRLVFICTHNSRRSHFGQVWAQVAVHYFGIKNIETYSGGTEATAFNLNAIIALQRLGFTIKPTSESTNPMYELFYSEDQEPISCFSKVYNDTANPSENFAAIMTCGEAEENCPYIPGAEIRIAITYQDPKEFDNTPLMQKAYDERCRQIATEMMYVFSRISSINSK